ncbi:MAG TPA: dihydrolipoyl dehydrogenase [Dehalococcoidia bacterium]|nr:dihydrolipoyl dehydrogenase [Dehalococcoidia bacterium]
MKNYDVIVIGSGAGMIIVDEAVEQGLKVALVDKGPIGGTCLNLGCVPSKMLIYAADRVVDIQEAGKLGIEVEIKSVDFAAIMKRMRKSRQESQAYVRKGIKESKNLDFYETEGHFVSDYTLEVGGKKIAGKKIFIASGSRPVIPPIKGLDGVEYLTNENVLELQKKPESLIIIGGGYVAVEYAHFFAAMGTRVTIIEMLDRLAQSEEPEMSKLLEKELKKHMKVYTNTQAQEIKKGGSSIAIVAKNRTTGKVMRLSAEKIMIAVGRRSNADLLKGENTGVEVDQRGFIKVDDYLETTKKNIFAVGDINGQQMFTHVANREAAIAWHNATSKKKVKMDYSAAPHAVYSHPQIASVGLTEENAKKDYHLLIGRAKYSTTAKGEAMMEEEGFAKAIVDAHTNKILGFHIIGPYAPELIQEVINTMAGGGDIDSLSKGMHIHPALCEVILRTFDNIEGD